MKFLLRCTLVLLFACPVCAEIYKWVDEKGNTHYSDSKPDHLPATTVDAPINHYRYQALPAPEFEPEESRSARPVVIYTTSWCRYCKKARSYFAANNIRYVERNIETSAQARREYDRLQGTGVPILRIGNTLMRGWDQSRFEKIYRRP